MRKFILHALSVYSGNILLGTSKDGLLKLLHSPPMT